MSAAVIASLAAVGVREDASAAAQVTPWLVLAVAGGWLAMLAGRWLLRRGKRTGPLLAVPCPCCTGRPMEFADCTCREDCGCPWCLAEEVGDDTLAMLRKPQAAPWPDGDTVTIDAVTGQEADRG